VSSTPSVTINFYATKQLRMNKCKVDSNKNFTMYYVTYLVKDTCKFFKVRDYEQSVMKSDRLFQARGPATANALSPMHCGTWCYQQGRWRWWPQSTSWSDFSDTL